MPFSESINIAICFNDEKQAINLSEKLRAITPHANFIITENLGTFLKAISVVPKIDCFIIDEKYDECLATEMIAQLKKNQKFKKSVIAVFSPNINIIDTKFFEISTDYMFDVRTETKDIVFNLKKLMLKNIAPVIPRDFNVLVLENSPEILELISMHLNDLGHHKVELCQDIKSAKECLLKKDYDLLLLDWNLDDGTCLDVIEFIKKNPVSSRTKHAVTVVITGRDDVDDIMTLLRYGIKDHIIKPFGFKEFEDKIGYAVEKNAKAV